MRQARPFSNIAAMVALTSARRRASIGSKAASSIGGETARLPAIRFMAHSPWRLPPPVRWTSGHPEIMPHAKFHHFRDMTQAFIALPTMADAVPGFLFARPVRFIWLGAAGWGWAGFSDRNVAERPFIDRHGTVEANVRTGIDAFDRRSRLTEVLQARADLHAEIQACKPTDDDLAQKLRTVKSARHARLAGLRCIAGPGDVVRSGDALAFLTVAAQDKSGELQACTRLWRPRDDSNAQPSD